MDDPSFASEPMTALVRDLVEVFRDLARTKRGGLPCWCEQEFIDEVSCFIASRDRHESGCEAARAVFARALAAVR